MRLFRRLAAPLIAVAICLLLALITLASLRFGRTGSESVSQSFGQIVSVVWDRSILPQPPTSSITNYRSWIETLLAATPILLTGLAAAVAFRANVLNIGAEGQFVLGAILATAVGLHIHSVILLLIAGALAGGLFAAMAAVLEQWRRVPIVLSTLLLNFIAIVLLKSLLQGPMHEAGQQLQSEQVAESVRLPHLFLNGTPTQLHIGFFVALAAAALVGFILRLTVFGFRLRAVGENATAARFAGIPIGRIAVLTLCLSGALAGLAGAIEISGKPPYLLLPGTGTSGFGFAGIAVALLGRLSPLGTVFAALFFGWLQTAFAALESELRVPFLALQATQGAILIAILILSQIAQRRRI